MPATSCTTWGRAVRKQGGGRHWTLRSVATVRRGPLYGGPEAKRAVSCGPLSAAAPPVASPLRVALNFPPTLNETLLQTSAASPPSKCPSMPDKGASLAWAKASERHGSGNRNDSLLCQGLYFLLSL